MATLLLVNATLTARQQMVGSPPRLAVDIEGMELNAALRELVGKVQASDPNIAGWLILSSRQKRLRGQKRKPRRNQLLRILQRVGLAISFQMGSNPRIWDTASTFTVRCVVTR